MSYPAVNAITPNAVQALQAKEMSHLSVKEREQIYEEIHGVDREFTETEDFLIERRCAFQHQVVTKIADGSSPFVRKAFGRDSAFIMDPKLQNMFLRAEYFSAENAVSRLEQFLQGKVTNFGDQSLTKPIYLSDLDSDAVAIIHSGFFQLLPSRDSAGRLVAVILDQSDLFIKDIRTFVRYT